jgi:hypothetical protein
MLVCENIQAAKNSFSHTVSLEIETFTISIFRRRDSFKSPDWLIEDWTVPGGSDGQTWKLYKMILDKIPLYRALHT